MSLTSVSVTALYGFAITIIVRDYYLQLQNHRPISNLSFLSKALERLVSLQLLPYIEQSGLLPPSQPGFRAHHSTETVLLSLLSDIYSALDRSQLTLLALYDVSAAVDMV